MSGETGQAADRRDHGRGAFRCDGQPDAGFVLEVQQAAVDLNLGAGAPGSPRSRRESNGVVVEYAAVGLIHVQAAPVRQLVELEEPLLEPLEVAADRSPSALSAILEAFDRRKTPGSGGGGAGSGKVVRWSDAQFRTRLSSPPEPERE